MEREIPTIKQDVSNIKSDVSTIKPDIATVNRTLADLSQQVGNLKVELSKDISWTIKIGASIGTALIVSACGFSGWNALKTTSNSESISSLTAKSEQMSTIPGELRNLETNVAMLTQRFDDLDKRLSADAAKARLKNTLLQTRPNTEAPLHVGNLGLLANPNTVRSDQELRAQIDSIQGFAAEKNELDPNKIYTISDALLKALERPKPQADTLRLAGRFLSIPGVTAPNRSGLPPCDLGSQDSTQPDQSGSQDPTIRVSNCTLSLGKEKIDKPVAGTGLFVAYDGTKGRGRGTGLLGGFDCKDCSLSLTLGTQTPATVRDIMRQGLVDTRGEAKEQIADMLTDTEGEATITEQDNRTGGAAKTAAGVSFHLAPPPLVESPFAGRRIPGIRHR